MLNGNGHTNGHANGSITPPGGERKPPRATRTLCRAIINGWLAELNDPAKMNEAIEALRAVLADPRTRPGTRTLAAKSLAEAMNQTVGMGLRLMEFEDKADRLDSGDATDRVEHFEVRIPEARARLE